MGITSYGVNDALAVKVWSKLLDHEALKYTDIQPLIGDDKNAILHRKTELSKGDGDKVTYAIRMQLNGAGFTENQLAEGNGETLSTFSDSLVINELGHVVGVKSKNTIDQQRVAFDLREEAKDGLGDWYAKRFSVAFFNQVCGNTVVTDVRFTGLNPVLPATRIIRQSGRTDDAALLPGDVFDLRLIDRAKEIATTSTPPMRPVRVGSGDRNRRDYNKTLTDKYVMYLHEYQVTSMRGNTSTGQWLDIEKAAMQGGNITNNSIYTGAIGEYNGVILRKSFDVTMGVSNAGAAVPNVRRAVMLGGQAAMIAFGNAQAGNGVSEGKYRWNEELFDHKRRLEVSAWTIHGIKKTSYNGLDYGTIVVSTYAVPAQ